MSRDSDQSPAGGWAAVLVDVAAEDADEIAGILVEGNLGAEISDAGLGRSCIRVYVAGDEGASRTLELARAHAGRDAAEPEVLRVADGHWVERYQASLSPFDLGARFRVLPRESDAADPGRIPLRLVPGRAFGTGEHPTTRLCAERLERLVRPGSRWLDLGCGSAILCIVAHHMGAATSAGVDIDAESVNVALDVVRCNDLEKRIPLATGTLSGIAPHCMDGLVCNISAPFLIEHARPLARVLTPGGWIVASGFLAEDRVPVGGALAAAGFEGLESREEAPWAVSWGRLGKEDG